MKSSPGEETDCKHEVEFFGFFARCESKELIHVRFAKRSKTVFETLT